MSVFARRSITQLLGRRNVKISHSFAALKFSPFHDRRARSFENSDESSGQIQVIFGPMFSGKTTELIRRCRRYQLAKYDCLMVKYARDIRYDDADSQIAKICTHDKITLPAISALRLDDVIDQLKSAEIVGIDEGQFFSDVVPAAEFLANLGKTVIISALDGDFRREGFGDILQLVPKAERIDKLTAVCAKCSREAAFTKRISSDTQLELIGGADKYTAVCRACYHRAESTDSDLAHAFSPFTNSEF